jgi:hypothetical protein
LDHTDSHPDLSGCNYGLIDLDCGVMVDISGLYFCDNSGSSITAGNSLDVSSNAVHFFNNNGQNNILVDISGIFQVGGADNSNGPVLKVMYTQEEAGGVTGSSSGANGSTARIITTNNAVDAIKLDASAGGVDIDAAAGKDVNVAGGQVALVSKDDAASAISLTTNIGTLETIVVTNTAGTDNASIALTATAGGITSQFAQDKEYTIKNANNDLKITLVDDSGTPADEKITVTNTNGTDNAAIGLTATAGGITNTYDESKDFTIADDSTGNKNSLVFNGDANVANRTITLTNGQGTGTAAIALTATIDAKDDSHFKVNTAAKTLTLEALGGGDNQVIVNSAGTGPNAIQINATAGGIDIDGGLGGDIDIKSTGKSVNITSTEADASAIFLSASAGGIDIESTDQNIDIKSNNANVNITSTASAANAIKIAAAGGVDINASTGVAIWTDNNVDISGAIDVNIDAIGGGVNISSSGNTGLTSGGTMNIISTTADVHISAGAGDAELTGLNVDVTATSGALTLGGAAVSLGSATGIDMTTIGPIKINSAAGIPGQVLTSHGGRHLPGRTMVQVYILLLLVRSVSKPYQGRAIMNRSRTLLIATYLDHLVYTPQRPHNLSHRRMACTFSQQVW